MSDHVLLNLLNECGESDKIRGLLSKEFNINPVIQQHECQIDLSQGIFDATL